MKARTLGRKAIIVGDRVRLDGGDTSGAEGDAGPDRGSDGADHRAASYRR